MFGVRSRSPPACVHVTTSCTRNVRIKTPSRNFEDRLLAVRSRYAVDLEEQIIVVRAAWNKYLRMRENAGGWADAPDELQSHVHKIAGSSGLFGYTEVGNIALDLDAELGLLPTSTAMGFDRISGRVSLLLDRLEDQANASLLSERGAARWVR